MSISYSNIGYKDIKYIKYCKNHKLKRVQKYNYNCFPYLNPPTTHPQIYSTQHFKPSHPAKNTINLSQILADEIIITRVGMCEKRKCSFKCAYSSHSSASTEVLFGGV